MIPREVRLNDQASLGSIAAFDVPDRAEPVDVTTSYCLLSTYPPTQCGLATFTAALQRAITVHGTGHQAGVVRVIDAKVSTVRPEVVGHLRVGDPDGPVAAAAALNRYDVAIVQHEYGIYGGIDGDEVLAVLDHVRVPVIAVLHTVLTRPTPHQRAVLERVIAAAEAIVVMSETARARLLTGYDIDAVKLTVIPHGAKENGHHAAAIDQRRTILTWGLLGPGKGIEWALAGLGQLRRLRPPPRYVIAGQTHPRVLAHEGEAYRLGLATRIRALRVGELVRFERGYLDERALGRLINRADVVLLPYDSHEQVTSGVLIEAVAAGKPVVSTAFPHAVELLAGGAGILVPHRDGPAIGAALLRVLTEPGLAAEMAAAAARLAPALRWPAVADRYRALADDLLSTRIVATR
jgi:polysaccharide biosynthesis protein PslF